MPKASAVNISSRNEHNFLKATFMFVDAFATAPWKHSKISPSMQRSKSLRKHRPQINWLYIIY